MRIVRAEVEHLEEVSTIYRALDTPFMQPSALERIRSAMKEGTVFVALENEHVQGAMTLEIVENSGEIVMIASRKKGAGRKLIEFAIQQCHAAHASKLWCWSLVRYHAEGFYQKMGFEEAFLLRKHWFGEDCWLFGKVIQ